MNKSKSKKEIIDNYEFLQKLFFIVEAIDSLNKKIGKMIPIDELEKESMRYAKRAQINLTKKEFNMLHNKLLIVGYIFCPRKDFIGKVSDSEVYNQLVEEENEKEN